VSDLFTKLISKFYPAGTNPFDDQPVVTLAFFLLTQLRGESSDLKPRTNWMTLLGIHYRVEE